MKYYSEKLDKIFDSEKDLKAAEKEHDEAEAKKAEAKALVTKESAEVTEAFKARNVARKAYNEKLVEARKEYQEALRNARDNFEGKLKESTEVLEKAETDFDNKLKTFQQAHPEGYHLTLKDGDNVVTYTNSLIDYPASLRKEFDNMLDFWSDFIRNW